MVEDDKKGKETLVSTTFKDMNTALNETKKITDQFIAGHMRIRFRVNSDETVKSTVTITKGIKKTGE